MTRFWSDTRPKFWVLLENWSLAIQSSVSVFGSLSIKCQNTRWKLLLKAGFKQQRTLRGFFKNVGQQRHLLPAVSITVYRAMEDFSKPIKQ